MRSLFLACILFWSWNLKAQFGIEQPFFAIQPASAGNVLPSGTQPYFRWVASDLPDGNFTTWTDRISGAVMTLDAGQYSTVPFKNRVGAKMAFFSPMLNSVSAQIQGTFYVLNLSGEKISTGGSTGMEELAGGPLGSWLGIGLKGGAVYEAGSGVYASLALPTVQTVDVVIDGVAGIGASGSTYWTNGVASCRTNFTAYDFTSLGINNNLGLAQNNGLRQYIVEMAFWTNAITTNDALALHNYVVTNYPAAPVWAASAPYYTNIASVSPNLWYMADYSGSPLDSSGAIWGDLGTSGSSVSSFGGAGAFVARANQAPNNHIALCNENVGYIAGGALRESYSQPYWVFCVCAWTNTSNVGHANVAFDMDSVDDVWLNLTDSNTGMYGGATLSTGSANITGNWTLYSCKFNGVSSILRSNAVQVASGNAGANAAAAFMAGGSWHVSSRTFQGKIAEIIFFGSNLSNSDRDSVEAYLRAKYSLW